MGREEKSLLSDPGSELRLGGREKKGEDSKWDGKAQNVGGKISSRPPSPAKYSILCFYLFSSVETLNVGSLLCGHGDYIFREMS